MAVIIQALMNVESKYRLIGFGLVLLIYLLPMPLAFLTLARGRSPWARLLALGWLAVAAILAGMTVT